MSDPAATGAFFAIAIGIVLLVAALFADRRGHR